MSDGWDDASTYGHVHSLPMPDSAGGGTFTSLRLVARNSGLFYLAATKQCLRLTKILANRMAHEQARPPAISPCLARARSTSPDLVRARLILHCAGVGPVCVQHGGLPPRVRQQARGGRQVCRTPGSSFLHP